MRFNLSGKIKFIRHYAYTSKRDQSHKEGFELCLENPNATSTRDIVFPFNVPFDLGKNLEFDNEKVRNDLYGKIVKLTLSVGVFNNRTYIKSVENIEKA
jgi:hypothetical protein